MKKTLLIAAATLFVSAVPAAAQDAESQSFTRDGVTYRYDVTQHDGYRVIEGRATPGTHFRLVVRGDRVTGRVNNRPVSFSTADMPKQRENALVASL